MDVPWCVLYHGATAEHDDRPALEKATGTADEEQRQADASYVRLAQQHTQVCVR